jgi:hypothetical protein
MHCKHTHRQGKRIFVKRRKVPMDPKLASFGAQTKSDEKINEQLKDPGADPATLSYNASGVKIYSATNSLTSF